MTPHYYFVHLMVFGPIMIALGYFNYFAGRRGGYKNGFREGYHQGFIDENLDITTQRRSYEQALQRLVLKNDAELKEKFPSPSDVIDYPPMGATYDS
jgi:hypothetical protein